MNLTQTNHQKPARSNGHVDRLPPYSSEAERGILGCILSDPKMCLPQCIERIGGSGEQFYDLRHQAIYKAMVFMWNEVRLVDVISLQDELTKQRRLEQVGGVAFISALPDAVASAWGLPEYLNIVQEKFMLRKIVQTCTEAVAKVFDFDGDSDDLIDQLEKDILAIRPTIRNDTPAVRELVQQAIVHIEDVWKRQGAIEGISTGLIDLDRISGGLHKGEVTIIAGYPGSGKTSLAMNFAEHAMLESKRKVGVFSLEMSAMQLVTRFLCSHARVNLRNIKDGFLCERDFAKLSGAAGRISNAAIWFEDESDLSIFKLRAKARRIWQQHGIELLVVDYLQLLTAVGGARKVESRQQEVADISRGIKAIARELNIPVVALSQLNDDGKLRESRAIGQDADNVWILKPEIPEQGATKCEALAVTLDIVKARNGPVGEVHLTFLKPYTRFESAAKIADEDVDVAIPNQRTPYND